MSSTRRASTKPVAVCSSPAVAAAVVVAGAVVVAEAAAVAVAVAAVAVVAACLGAPAVCAERARFLISLTTQDHHGRGRQRRPRQFCAVDSVGDVSARVRAGEAFSAAIQSQFPRRVVVDARRLHDTPHAFRSDANRVRILTS